MKRILSIILSLAIVQGLFCTQFAYAEADTLTYTEWDKTSVTVPANMVTQNYVANASRNTGEVKGELERNSANNIIANHVLTLSAITERQDGFGGLVIKNKNQVSDPVPNRPDLIFDSSKSYVISARFKQNSGAAASFGVAISKGVKATTAFTKEYGSAGMALTEEYQDFKGTIKLNSGYDSYAPEFHQIVFGFPAGTPKDVNMSIDASSADAMYLAEEIPYDISVTAVEQKPYAVSGSSVRYKAELTNQLGLTGYLDQSFDWYVMNEDKTAIVSDISVAADDNSAYSTVIISDSAQSGTYSIVAVSKTNDNMMTAAPLTVKNISSFMDKNGIMPANLIPQDQESSARYFVSSGGRNTTGVTVATLDDWSAVSKTRVAATIEAASDITERAQSVFCGKTVDLKTPLTAKNYVIGMRVKKLTDEDARIGASLNNDNTASVSVGKVYGKTGMTLSDEYSDYKDTIVLADRYDSTHAKQYLTVGLPAGVNQGAKAVIDTSTPDAVYLAEEVPYEMAINIGKTALKTGESTDISASVLNQIGLTGALSQEVEYFVLNADRTEEADALSVQNGRVYADKDAKSGVYTIVAQNSDASVVKGVAVTVLAEERISECTISQSGNDVIASAAVRDTTAENVLFILGEYNGELLEKVSCENVSVKNGAANAELTLLNSVANNNMRLFVWEYPSLRPIPDVNGNLQGITVEAMELLYGD